ncbi:hypothetical protein ACFY1J_31000 [Streptomyces sp. NPDC001406]|uniref:hypothetical protein n=1 Tax=Streptomyces sp. NPDC001406 TaxID=3364572 RepID=UPI00368338A8
MTSTDAPTTQDRLPGPSRVDAARSAPAGQFIEQARRLALLAEDLLKVAVVAERARGTSWDEIGKSLGDVSKSAAHARYSSMVKEWMESPAPEDVSEPEPFELSYGELSEKWAEAARIVDAQVLIAELRGAAAKVSNVGRLPVGDAKPKAAAQGLPSQATRGEHDRIDSGECDFTNFDVVALIARLSGADDTEAGRLLANGSRPVSPWLFQTRMLSQGCTQRSHLNEVLARDRLQAAWERLTAEPAVEHEVGFREGARRDAIHRRLAALSAEEATNTRSQPDLEQRVARLEDLVAQLMQQTSAP